MLSFLNSIHFAELNNIKPASIFFIIILLFLIARWIKTQKALQHLTPKKWRTVLFLNASNIKQISKYLLFTIGSLFLLFTLLRPQWNKKEEKVEQEGRDILIALDISRSMLARDFKPTRLEFAKQKIKKLLYNLKCERAGLIIFSGEAILQCPLTTDYADFFMFLDSIDTEVISSGTTTIDGALHQAISIFDTMPTKKTKILSLFTDGEDFSTNLSDVKEKATKLGIAIFTFGVGTPNGAPIPVLDPYGKHIGFEKDSKGTIIMSKLNEGILKHLANETGGKYIHMHPSDTDIKEFISLVQSFEKDSLEERSLERYQEQYPYFIGISFLCFVLEWLL